MKLNGMQRAELIIWCREKKAEIPQLEPQEVLAKASKETGISNIPGSSMKVVLEHLGLRAKRKSPVAKTAGLRELILQLQGRIEQLEGWKAAAVPQLEQLARIRDHLLEKTLETSHSH